MKNIDHSLRSLAEEHHGLLSGNLSQDPEQITDLSYHGTEPLTSQLNRPAARTPRSPRSPSASLNSRSPRTPNRVRFNLPPVENQINAVHGSPPPPYDDDLSESGHNSGSNPHSHSIPLLYNINQTFPSSYDDAQWGGEDVLTWAEQEQQRPKSGMRSAFMNMANSILGAGIIGQPYAFQQAGLLPAIILLVMLTVMVDWTIGLIVINSKLSGTNSFQGTMKHCFGRKGFVVISLGQWAFGFGGMVAFGIIVGDTIPHVVLALWPGVINLPVLSLLANRRVVITIFISLISYPLSLYRDISKLSKASTLAFISMMIIIITVVSQAPFVPVESRGTLDDSLTVKAGLFQAISVISFALVCHHNSLLIYDSLKTPTLDRFATVTHYSTGVSMLACLLIALSGYLTFGSFTRGNVLNNFPPDNILVNLARLFFGLNMLTTLPLEAFVCREVMINYWFAGQPFSIFVHIFFTTFLVFSAMIFTLITCDLGVVFEIIGAISACGLAYVLPPLCYLRLSTRSWKSIPAVACIIFGFSTMTISLTQTFLKLFRHEEKSISC